MAMTTAATSTTTNERLSSSSPYVLIVDGGSTGSRLHAFHYVSETGNHNNNTVSSSSSLERLTSTRVFQPLTAFVNASASELAEHVLPLFTPELAQLIPVTYQATTPVYYAATAGMRLVPPHLQAQVYQRLQQGLQQHPDFPYQIGKLFTLSGDMEAFYGVVACNYLQQQNASQPHATTVVAALDLGGASTQVALPRPTTTTPSNHQRWTTDSVYAVSHLAYGVDQFQQQQLSSDKDAFHHLCRNSPTTNASDCADFIRPHLLAARDTLSIPHDFHATTLSTTTTEQQQHNPLEFWAMSLYFYTMDTIRQFTAPMLDAAWPTPTLHELRTATQAFCTIPIDTLLHAIDQHPYTNAQSIVERCYQAVYIIELLKVMGFPDDGDETTGIRDSKQQQHYRQIRFLLDVNGSEVEWTLGMALAVQNESPEPKGSPEETESCLETEAVSESTSPSSIHGRNRDEERQEEGACGTETKAGNENLTCTTTQQQPRRNHDGASVLTDDSMVLTS